MAKVQFNNLSYSFGTKNIFNNLSLEINDGEILGIVGPSGCGKTTLIRCLAGLINPSNGSIKVGDTYLFNKESKINIPPEKRNIGMVFQDYAVWPHKSVYKNIEYPLIKKKIDKQERATIISNVLKQVRMEDYANHMPVQLSGGQQQRVAIARALVSSKDLIILDEPITNLDAKLREEMLVEIRLLQKQLGTTIIYITHDQEAALQLCDRIAIMGPNGDIVQVANDEDIILKPKNRFVYEFIGVSNFIRCKYQDNKLLFICPKQNIEYDLPLPLSTLEEQKEYDMAIRPIDIIFNDASNTKAKIKHFVFLGNQYDYFLDFYGHELRMQRNILDVLKGKKYKENDEIGIEFLSPVFYDAKDSNA